MPHPRSRAPLPSLATKTPRRVQKWWRRPLLTATGVAAGSVMVIKTDVQGGMPPSKECVVGEDTLVEVRGARWGGGLVTERDHCES